MISNRNICSTLIVLCWLLLMTGCSINAGKTVPSPASLLSTPDQVIGEEVCDALESGIANSCVDAVNVYVDYRNDGFDISVYIDPLIINYQLASNLEISVNVVKEVLAKYDVPLTNFSINGVSYEDGKSAHIISWSSSDLETGLLYDNKNGTAIANATVERVFSYCDYPD